MFSDREQLIIDETGSISIISNTDPVITGPWDFESVHGHPGDVEIIHNQDPDSLTDSAPKKSKLRFYSWIGRNVNWKKMVVLITLCWSTFAAWACSALLAPFLPHEALIKHVPSSLVGFIFGVYPLAMFITAPLFGLGVHKIGLKFLFVSGNFVCGVCSVLFGLLEYCPVGVPFTTLCFVIRVVQAVGSSGYITASLTIAAKEFPNKVTFIVGILETSSGVGLMIGPLIGGAFYQIGGFGLGFYVVGVMLVMTAAMSYTIITEHTLEKPGTEESVPVRKLFFNGATIILSLSIVTAMATWGFLDPTLAVRLDPFGLSTVLIGLVFFIVPAVYAAAAPFWGWLANRFDQVYSFLALGNLACGACFLLMGPAPFLGLPYALWLNVVSLCLMGITIPCTMIMSYRGYIDTSINLKFEQNVATFGCISGLYNATMSLGSFIGPTVGAIINDEVGFDWTCVICAGLYILVGVLSLIYFLVLPKCCVAKPGELVSRPV